MNAQELIINCCYAKDGTTIQDILKSSFTAFLKREIEKITSVTHDHIG